jgi:hypothetical protein
VSALSATPFLRELLIEIRAECFTWNNPLVARLPSGVPVSTSMLVCPVRNLLQRWRVRRTENFGTPPSAAQDLDSKDRLREFWNSEINKKMTGKL